jgi:hypothetical protein
VVLPNATKAVIDSTKVRDYLPSSSHPIGRFKQSFFVALGYSRDQWQQLEVDLLELAVSGNARIGQKSEYGQKYEVRSRLEGPSGNSAEVVSIWIILEDEEIPGFVTAFPGGKR